MDSGRPTACPNIHAPGAAVDSPFDHPPSHQRQEENNTIGRIPPPRLTAGAGPAVAPCRGRPHAR